MDFSEKYFPIRLALDSGSEHADRAQTNISHLRPVPNVIAGPDARDGATSPAGPVMPGHDHIDVLTVSPLQNNGQPEPVTTHCLGLLF